MAKKLTQAQKIRNYREKHPTATIADIAKALNVRYQAVHQVLKPKADAKPTKQNWKVLHISTSKKPATPIMIDMTQKADGTITEKVVGVTKEMMQSVIDDLRTEREVKTDNVNHPAHYKKGGIETIDFLKAKLTPEEFRGYLKGNVLKYLSRANDKGNYEEDMLKARWYLNREVAEFTKE